MAHLINKTSLRERMSYGSYFIGQNMIYFLVFQFLMLFYTDVVGLSAAAVGTMFLIARLFDAANDPMMGVMVDRVQLRGGKFLPWVRLVVLVMPIVTVLLFLNVSDGGRFALLYAYITYILWGIVYTISDVPIFALATMMTDVADERVDLISLGRIGAGIGSVVISLFLMNLLERYGWNQTVILLSFLSLLTMLPICLTGKERVNYEQQKQLTLKEIIGFVKSNKYLLIFFGALVIASLTNTSLISLNYFALYNLGNQDYLATLTVANMIPMLAVPFVVPALIKRFGKKLVFCVGLIISIVSSILFYFIGYENILLVHLFTALKGISQLQTYMIGLFTVDCIEYGTYKTKQRAEGVSFSLQTFTVKLSAAIAGAISGFVLENIGYVPGVSQSSDSLQGIWNMYTLYPIFGLLAALFIIWRYYDLSEKDVEKMLIKNQQLEEEGSVLL